MRKPRAERAERGGARSAGELATLLRGAGLRRTSPRIAVLQFLERAKSPLSHGEIAEALAATELDRVTVYRNLLDLVGANLVSRTDLGDHVWRFALRRGDEQHAVEHPHFLCVSCGGVTCLPGASVSVTASRGVPRSVAARAVEVQVKGECDTCARP